MVSELSGLCVGEAATLYRGSAPYPAIQVRYYPYKPCSTPYPAIRVQLHHPVHHVQPVYSVHHTAAPYPNYTSCSATYPEIQIQLYHPVQNIHHVYSVHHTVNPLLRICTLMLSRYALFTTLYREDLHRTLLSW